MAHGTYLYLLTVMICEYSRKDHMHMSTKPRLASLYVQHLAFPTCEETSPSLQDICQKIICTLPHVKNKPSPKAYAKVYKTQTEERAHAQRSYAHVYKTQTSPSLHATSSTCEEQAHAQRSYAHLYKTQTSLSLHATSCLPHM